MAMVMAMATTVAAALIGVRYDKSEPGKCLFRRNEGGEERNKVVCFSGRENVEMEEWTLTA